MKSVAFSTPNFLVQITEVTENCNFCSCKMNTLSQISSNVCASANTDFCLSQKSDKI